MVSNIDIIRIERGNDLFAVILSKVTGKRLMEIYYHEDIGFYFEEKEHITWMLSEFEEIINFCKGDVYSPDKVFGKIFKKNMESLKSD